MDNRCHKEYTCTACDMGTSSSREPVWSLDAKHSTIVRRTKQNTPPTSTYKALIWFHHMNKNDTGNNSILVDWKVEERNISFKTIHSHNRTPPGYKLDITSIWNIRLFMKAESPSNGPDHLWLETKTCNPSFTFACLNLSGRFCLSKNNWRI